VNTNSTNFQDAFNAGLNQLKVLDADVVLAIDADGAPHAFSLEHFRPTPQSKRGAVKVYDERSFAEYVIRHREPGTVVYFDPDTLKIVGVIDGHSEGGTGWNRHRVELHTRLTPEWAAWSKQHGQVVNQKALATFIENHVEDVAEPAGSVLLEMVKNLSIRRSIVFERGIDLDNGGVQLTYHDAEGGATDGAKATLTIPRELVLGLSPFKGLVDTAGAKVLYRLIARLRWELAGPNLQLWIELVRPDLIAEQAFRDRLATVAMLLQGKDVPTAYGEVPAEVVPLKTE
jgi:uncharacterized protein YfdQ (DUF2303 family)